MKHELRDHSLGVVSVTLSSDGSRLASRFVCLFVSFLVCLFVVTAYFLVCLCVISVTLARKMKRVVSAGHELSNYPEVTRGLGGISNSMS